MTAWPSTSTPCSAPSAPLRCSMRVGPLLSRAWSAWQRSRCPATALRTSGHSCMSMRSGRACGGGARP
eukprot:10367378-Alexandrium_andersonii.AAC.1